MKQEKINDAIALAAVYGLCLLATYHTLGAFGDWTQFNHLSMLFYALVPITGLMFCYALIRHLME